MCSCFFLEFSPQIAETTYFLQKPKPLKIVFLLTLNGRALRQVKRLLKILYSKDHYYYIHVDVVSDYCVLKIIIFFTSLSCISLFAKFLHGTIFTFSDKITSLEN